MNQNLLIFLIAAAIVVTVFGVVMLVRKQSKQKRSDRLRNRFGPEYDLAASKYGDYTLAEQDLEERERRSRQITLRPLSAQNRERFAEAWRSVQAHFVDDPGNAVIEADRLLDKLMSQRGYPIGDFEQQVCDLSVEHPRVVGNYRAAHLIAERQLRAEASTDDLREALIQYRVLYEELLGLNSLILDEVKQ